MYIRRVYFALCLVVSVACARADFTFIHCSDMHFGAGENHVTDAKLFAEMASLDPKPAFVVSTGDVCENGTDAQYQQYREALKNLGDVKMYTTTGNHDVRWNPRGKEGYTLGTGMPLYQSWDYENIHFVALDATVLLEHWGHISREQLNWLKKDLAKAGRDKPVIIGFHHWVGRESVQVDNEAALFEVVRPYNVVLWLQGHGHSDVEWSINGVPATMVGGLYQGSYNIIRVTSDELQISKRFIPDPKKKPGEELLQKDKSAPDESIKRMTRPLMTVPLKRRPAPRWDARAKLVGRKIEVSAMPPADATLSYRVNAEKPAPLNEGRVMIATDKLAPGQHVITVIAKLSDGREFQHPLTVNIPGIRPAWSIDVGGEVQSRLVRAGKLLLVSSMSNDLIALDAATGQQRYRFKTNGPIFTACHVDQGVAYFGSADHFVYAIDVATGKLKWKSELGGAVLAGPSVAQGVVCVGTTDTKIYGLEADSGAQIWTVQGKNMYQSKTATDGERFYVGGWDNHFRCIDAKTGKLVWDLELGRKHRPDFSAFSPAITAPAVGDTRVFVSTNDGILHGLNLSDGSEAWKIDWKKMGYSSPLFRDGRVYAALSDEGKVFCVNAATGEFNWTTETGAVIYDSSFAADTSGKHVFIANVEGTLNCLRASDGKIGWRYRLGPGHLLGSPVADDHFVYMGSMSGKVVAIPINAGEAP